MKIIHTIVMGCTVSLLLMACAPTVTLSNPTHVQIPPDDPIGQLLKSLEQEEMRQYPVRITIRRGDTLFRRLGSLRESSRLAADVGLPDAHTIKVGDCFVKIHQGASWKRCNHK